MQESERRIVSLLRSEVIAEVGDTPAHSLGDIYIFLFISKSIKKKKPPSFVNMDESNRAGDGD